MDLLFVFVSGGGDQSRVQARSAAFSAVLVDAEVLANLSSKKAKLLLHFHCLTGRELEAAIWVSKSLFFVIETYCLSFESV